MVEPAFFLHSQNQPGAFGWLESTFFLGDLWFQYPSQKILGLLENPTDRGWDLQLYHQQKERRKQIPATYLFLPIFLNQLQYLKGHHVHLLMGNTPETRDREEEHEEPCTLGAKRCGLLYSL